MISLGQSATEELILGIGGGLGAAYILWQFTGHHPIVTLGFRNQYCGLKGTGLARAVGPRPELPSRL